MRAARIAAALVLAALLPAGAARAQRRLTLEEAVDLALKADPVVAEARIGKDRSKLQVLRSQLDRVSITVDGSIREQFNKGNIGGPPITISQCATATGTFAGLGDPLCGKLLGGTASQVLYGDQQPEYSQGLSNLSATVNVPLFSGFKVSSNVAQKQRLDEAAGVQIRQARKDTALAVARAYWAVRRLELARDVVTVALGRLRDSEAVAGARFQAGLAPPIDRNRALSRRLQQEATVNDLTGQAREQAAQLAGLLGIDDDVALVDAPEVQPGGPPSLDDLVRQAERTRPELARARLLHAAQEQVVRIARADWFPQLGAYGYFQYGNNQYNPASGARSFGTDTNPFSNASLGLSVGLSLSMNFFNMFTTYTTVGDARFELARLEQEIRLARRTVTIDVRVARERLAHLYAQRAPLLGALDVVRDNVAIIEARYKNGEALVIEVFDAQVDLANVERQLADLSAQIRLGWLELQAALGDTVGQPG